MILLVWSAALLFLVMRAALIMVNIVQGLLTLTGCIISIRESVPHRSTQCMLMEEMVFSESKATLKVKN